MTRKEAISELQKAIDLIKQNGKDWLDERDIPILEMAIAALELSDSIMLQLDCKMFHSGVDVESTISEVTPSVQFAKDICAHNNDCISRQAAIDAVGYYSLHSGDNLLFADNALKELPSAQPKIIHCRDCKYWQDQEDGVVEVPICARPQNNHEKYPLVMLIDGDGFCSFVERRADE